MWPANYDYEEDFEKICSVEYIPWDVLRGKSFFITGATGLIGFTLINALIYVNYKRKLGIKILALVRDVVKAKERFAAALKAGDAIQFITGTVEDLPRISSPIDYIIHGASLTASSEFIERPVETIRIAVDGTEKVLELAKSKRTERTLYLSSMEVYGYPLKGHKVQEHEIGAFTPLNLRNSYPISKQMCECLCCAYVSEYKVPAIILRLTQTVGPNAKNEDSRIFAELERCVQEKRDIVLRTPGTTERSYLYTADAVTAILTTLLKGQPGQAYNAADERTYCSISEMANRFAASGGLRLRYEVQDEKGLGYPSPFYMDLDTTLIKRLGWEPLDGYLI